MAWLLVTVSTAGAAPSLRVYVWRKVRGLGAVYLQQSVCLLPARPEVVRQVRRVLDRVRRDGGTARMLRIDIDAADEADVVAEFQAARDAEYEDLLERLPSFFAELEREVARDRATFAEVEENEADLTRFRSWFDKIEARDYFSAPLGERARTELARAEAALAAFEEAALAAEAPVAEPPPSRRRLRSVDGRPG